MNELDLYRGLGKNLTTTNFNKQIDSIFLRNSKHHFISCVYETYFSDHKPIFISVDESVELSNIEIENHYITLLDNKKKKIIDELDKKYSNEFNDKI